MTAAAHKFHGPKGIGFMFIRKDRKLQPFMQGGAQERNMRAGTENLYGIVGFAKALELAEAKGGSVAMPVVDNGWVKKAQVRDPAGNLLTLIQG